MASLYLPFQQLVLQPIVVGCRLIFLRLSSSQRYCLLSLVNNNSKQTSLCQSSLGCQQDTARICCWTPCCGAVAAGRRAPAPSIDISCRRGAWQQTRRMQQLLSIDGTDRRTEGHSTGFVDPAPHATRALSIRHSTTLYAFCDITKSLLRFLLF